MLRYSCSKETKRGVGESEGPRPHKNELTFFLVLTRLIEIREIWLFHWNYRLVKVDLTVKFEGIVGVVLVKFCLAFAFICALVSIQSSSWVRSREYLL